MQKAASDNPNSFNWTPLLLALIIGLFVIVAAVGIIQSINLEQQATIETELPSDPASVIDTNNADVVVVETNDGVIDSISVH